MREGLRAVGGRCKRAVKNPRATWQSGKKRTKRGFVYFITSDKNIQAVKTGAAVAVLTSGIQSVGSALNIGLELAGLVPIPLPWVTLGGVIVIFYVADYADENTDEWRELVEETTGEEAADDEADADAQG